MSEIEKALWPGWETVRLIGRGNFGTVYEIQRDVLGETEKAALKVISIPQNDSDIEELYSDGYDDESITNAFKSHLKSIVAEYSLMRKMNGCSNIVNCDDVRYIQHDDGIGWDIFIKMELLTPLTKVVATNCTEATVIRIAKDMCTALELCKKHEIVHRDIKPQNIFVSLNGDYKLGDFGIAKTVEKTMGGTKIGTYKYMAPEVYHYQPYGHSADIYSLGLVLYWLLNERRAPFMPLPPAAPKYDDEENAKERRFSGEKLSAPAHGSEDLQKIVLKACAFDPEARYESAAAMLDDLNKLSGGTAVASSAVILDDQFDKEQEEDKTTVPAFGVDPREKADDVALDDLDATDGPSFITKPTPDNKQNTETPCCEGNPITDKFKDKCNFKYLLIALGVLVAVVLFALLRSCDSERSNDNLSTVATDGQSSTVTTGTHVTSEQTTIADFTAATGSEDGSVILNFTVQGQDSDDWKVTYKADGEEEKSVTFSGHMVTINGLTIGSAYTFHLEPVNKLFVVGTDTVEYTASGIVYAEDLVIEGIQQGTLIASWKAPEGSDVKSWTVRCYNDAGYDKTVTVETTQASFQDIDVTQAYTVEVNATGMTMGIRGYVSANSLSVKSLRLNDSNRNQLSLSWEFDGTAPKDGWLILYSVDGSTEQQVVKCAEPNGVIFPIVPGSHYAISIQSADGNTVFGGETEFTAPEPLTFSGYLLTAANMEFKMCKTPAIPEWTQYNVPAADYKTTYAIGENASFAVQINHEYNASADEIVILFVIRDASGKIVSTATQSHTWTSMWYRGFGRINIPALPQSVGEYTLEVYFNSALAHTQSFTMV